MSKRMITEAILQRSKHVSSYFETKGFTWKEVQDILREANIELQDNDIVTLSFQEEEYSHEDAYSEPHYLFRVERDRLETDDEYKKRKESQKKSKEQQLERQKELYLKLKKQFEGENT